MHSIARLFGLVTVLLTLGTTLDAQAIRRAAP